MRTWRPIAAMISEPRMSQGTSFTSYRYAPIPSTSSRSIMATSKRPRVRSVSMWLSISKNLGFSIVAVQTEVISVEPNTASKASRIENGKDRGVEVGRKTGLADQLEESGRPGDLVAMEARGKIDARIRATLRCPM